MTLLWNFRSLYLGPGSNLFPILTWVDRVHEPMEGACGAQLTGAMHAYTSAKSHGHYVYWCLGGRDNPYNAFCTHACVCNEFRESVLSSAVHSVMGLCLRLKWNTAEIWIQIKRATETKPFIKFSPYCDRNKKRSHRGCFITFRSAKDILMKLAFVEWCFHQKINLSNILSIANSFEGDSVITVNSFNYIKPFAIAFRLMKLPTWWLKKKKKKIVCRTNLVDILNQVGMEALNIYWDIPSCHFPLKYLQTGGKVMKTEWNALSWFPQGEHLCKSDAIVAITTLQPRECGCERGNCLSPQFKVLSKVGGFDILPMWGQNVHVLVDQRMKPWSMAQLN